ncbi:MAG: sporulation protein [candidate division Zixibacteria bacterium]|nr:sporulation protein [candidate division Zixibacteria bacterium]
MMSNNVVEILKGVVGELREIAKSETVIGQPVTVGDKTVIPIVKISVGFGAGGGQGEDDKARAGFGGGGGGGAKIEPAAFIIMDDDGVKLIPVGKGKWDTIIDAIPGIAKKLGKMKDSLTSDKGKDTDSADEPTEDTSEEA